jgi:LPXTG-motif cell wall-anchored protein
MLSAIEYPHWLMLAGAFLVLSGLIGLAFRKKSEDEGVQSPAPSPIQAAVEPEMKAKRK